MNSDEGNKQVDRDILRGKADILRVNDIIPPFGVKKGVDAKNISVIPDKDNQPKRTNPGHNIAPEEIIPIKELPAKQSKAAKSHAAIPKFDLAKDIMAEQRKITAAKRKRAGQKNQNVIQKPDIELVDYKVELQKPIFAGKEKIISEIVARDIEKLCRSDHPAAQENPTNYA